MSTMTDEAGEIIRYPCESGNSDDWFIERDGKQYPDDPDLDTETKREALIARRRARQACRTECPFRRPCLAAALEERPTHGTWGGYYPEELRKLFKALDDPGSRRQRGVE